MIYFQPAASIINSLLWIVSRIWHALSQFGIVHMIDALLSPVYGITLVDLLNIYNELNCAQGIIDSLDAEWNQWSDTYEVNNDHRVMKSVLIRELQWKEIRWRCYNLFDREYVEKKSTMSHMANILNSFYRFNAVVHLNLSEEGTIERSLKEML